MRKYLDDIGVTQHPDTWNEDDKRQEKWAREREEYGFDERETWALEFSFYLWLYERLKNLLMCAALIWISTNLNTMERGTHRDK